MRRQIRRTFNEEKETKKIVMISVAVLIIAVLTFAITFIVYSNYLNKSSDIQMAEFKNLNIVELENVEETTSQASSSMGMSVNEVEQENKNSKEENTKIAINTSNMQKEITNQTNEVETKQIQTKKEEKVLDPTFIKPVEGEVSVAFAKEKLVYSNTLQEWVTHNGIDIKAEKTTIVKASAEGTIKSIKNDPRYGITVVIEHTNGFKSVYSNLLTAEFVKEGEKVKQGQTIGTVGNTATFEVADEAHLHFEIMKEQEYLDPTLYIQ